MKKSARLAALMALSTLLVSTASAQAGTDPKAVPSTPSQPGTPATTVRPAAPTRPQSAEPGKVTPEMRGQMADKALEMGMKQLGAGLKSLKENIGNAEKKEENLKTITNMERATLSMKSAEPSELNGADHAKAVHEFKKRQIQLMEHLLQLETLVLDDKTEQAKETLNKIEAFRNESHKELKKPEPAPTK